LKEIIKWLNSKNWQLAWSKNSNFFKVYSSFDDFYSRNNNNDLIIWMVDNPGKQDQEIMKSKEGELLRGSFYPLPSSDWEKDAYL